MTALEYLIDGLEAELALERELGVRVIECDRAILEEGRGKGEEGRGKREEGTGRDGLRPVRGGDSTFAFVFLHDRPLSHDGAEMVARITAALKTTPEAAPLVVAPPLPKSRIYVVLGGLALRKWFPGRNLSPGEWFKSDAGADVLVTYSPEYLRRFSPGSMELKKTKLAMWASLKTIEKRLANS